MRRGPQTAATALEALCERHGVGGAQYVLTTAAGERVVEHCAGLADAHRKREVTPATTFNLYSLTKPFTAAAAFALASDGRLDLDAAVSSAAVLPGLAAYGSVRDAVEHRAGFSNPMPLRWVHLADEDAAFDEAGFVERALATQVSRAPRLAPRYSNLGYLAVGRAIERASGRPFRDALLQHMASRLPRVGRGEIGFAIVDRETHALGHLPRRGAWPLVVSCLVGGRFVDTARGRWVTLRPHHVNGSAYGGLTGSARGLASLARALLAVSGDGIGAAGSDSRALARRAIPGWSTGVLDGRTWCAHAGGGLGYYGEMRLYPEHGFVSVLLTNGPGARQRHWLDGLDRLSIHPSAR